MRRLEIRDGKSQKFWCVSVSGAEMTTQWGRIGTDGQTKTKAFADAAAAQAAADKAAAAKLKKGYAEIVAEDTPEAEPICQDVPPVSTLVPTSPSYGLVLGMGADGEHVAAVGGQGRDLYFSAVDGTFTARPSPGPGLRGAWVRGNEVWVAGEYGYIAYSPDRGDTWEKLGSKARGGCLFGIVMDEQGHLWTAGDGGWVGRSTDGKKFRKVSGVKEDIARITSTPLGVLIPTDSPGRLYIGSAGKIRKTGLEAGVDLMKATVTPRGTIVVVGLGGKVFRSTDEGETFAAVKSGVTQMLTSVDHLPDGRVIAVGGGGVILVSYDDGESFKRIKRKDRGVLWASHPFFDALLVGGEKGLVLQIGEPAPREKQALPELTAAEPEAPELPSEKTKQADPAAEEHPAWAAPAGSTEVQQWTPPKLPLEVVNEIHVSPQLRAWLYPRHGGIETGPRPLPSLPEAWAALRLALWAADHKQMDAEENPSGIWKYASSDDAGDRALGQRLLDPKPHIGSLEQDLALLGVVLGAWGSFVSEYDATAHELAADFLVASVGLGGAIERCFLALEKLPYTSPGPFGRLKVIMAQSDANHAEGREATLAAIQHKLESLEQKKASGGYVSEDNWADPRWVASFLLPLGPDTGDEEQQLHQDAMRFLSRFGNFGVHACGIAAGDAHTLEQFIAANDGIRSEFFSPQPRLYLASVLELCGGASVGPVLAKMKPSSPWEDDPGYNGLWCQILAHVAHDSALTALVDEYHNMPEQGWAVAGLVTAARFDRVRVLSFLGDHEEGELIDLVKADLEHEQPRAPEVAAAAGSDQPCAYVPPGACFPVGLPAAADIAPAGEVIYDEAELDAIYEITVDDDRFRFDGVPLQRCDADQIEAFVSLREKWQRPMRIKEIALVPAALHERLMVLGFAISEWEVRDTLPLVLRTGGLSHLPMLTSSLEAPSSLEQALEVALPFGHVDLVPVMAGAFAAKKNKAAAKKWITRHPHHAAAGAVAMLREDPKDEPAARVLRFIAARGHRDVALEYARAAKTEAAVTRLLDLDPLTPAKRKKLKVPAFAAPGKLPGLVTNKGAAAKPAAVEEEILRLAFSNADEPHPEVIGGVSRYTTESRAAFVWALFEAWLEDGASAKAQWCLQALGFWGDDQVAARLTVLARRWPGEGAGKRAQWALDALANIGTDLALTNINLLAEKSRFPAFKEAARDRIDAMARMLGLTTDELADRLTPRLDLDEEGGAVLDFGPRQFSISFDEALRPVLRDGEDRIVKRLPKPAGSDDKELAKAAAKRFKLLKSTARAAASLQIARLERAMQTQRPVPAPVFLEHFASHPWMTHLAQRLVWCLAGEPAKTFRVVEDGTLSDRVDETVTLSDTAEVQVVHPLLLSAESLQGWRDSFSDYEVLQPFEQLERPVFTATAGEKSADAVTRHAGKKVSFGQLRGMERKSWERWYDAQVEGVAQSLGKKSYAVLYVEPGWHPSETADEIGEQTIEKLQLHGNLERFGDLDPIRFSELIYDIDRMLAG